VARRRAGGTATPSTGGGARRSWAGSPSGTWTAGSVRRTSGTPREPRPEVVGADQGARQAVTERLQLLIHGEAHRAVVAVADLRPAGGQLPVQRPHAGGGEDAFDGHEA